MQKLDGQNSGEKTTMHSLDNYWNQKTETGVRRGLEVRDTLEGEPQGALSACTHPWLSLTYVHTEET